MNYKLIMLPNPILISDEEIKKGDYFYCTRGDIFPNLIAKASEINFDLEDSDGDGQPTILYNGNKILYCFCKKIVAGVHDLPKLDLSAIAEEIGLVDVEKLAWETLFSKWDSRDIIEQKEQYALKAFIEGFKAAQSLNEKKYSEEDLEDFYIWKDEERWFSFSDGKWNYTFEHGTSMSKSSYEKNYRKTTKELLDMWQKQRKPKKYNVEVEMEHCEYCDGDGVYIDNDSNRVSCEVHAVHTKSKPKITNNTIKITKILK